MSRSDYLVKRADLLQRIGQIDNDIDAAQHIHKPSNVVADVELFSRFLFTHSLMKTDNIREQIPLPDRAVVRDFLQQTISYIEVIDDKVTKIAFNSPDGGEDVHRFIYKA